MSDLSILVKDTFPANGDVSVPLQSNITLTLSGLDYDSSSLKEGMFLEGPDTDQFVGPGQLDLISPNNISQGEIDDFLNSPGYQGIVGGAVTVTGISGDTVVTFNPTLPMAPLTDYRLNITGVTDSVQVDIDGFLIYEFTTGTGSIETIPSNISTSILAVAISEGANISTVATPLQVTSITPADLSVENKVDLKEIVIEFNKEINDTTLDGNITVETVPVTDHPNASTNSLGDLAISTTVEGKKLKIKL